MSVSILLLFLGFTGVDAQSGDKDEDERGEEEEKLALFMKRNINFQQMKRCKEVLLRKDWRKINLLRVAGLQEDGPA